MEDLKLSSPAHLYIKSMSGRSHLRLGAYLASKQRESGSQGKWRRR